MWAYPETYYLDDKADVSFYVFVLLAFVPFYQWRKNWRQLRQLVSFRTSRKDDDSDPKDL